MTEIEKYLTLKEFEKYLEQQYQSDFELWFQVTKDNRSLPFVAPVIFRVSDMVLKGAKCSDTTIHEYYFSIATFFIFLIPQVVGKLTNDSKAMWACCTSLDAPAYFGGLYGIVDPYFALGACKLLPFKNERTRYFELLRHILHLYIYNIGNFLTTHDPIDKNDFDEISLDEIPSDYPETNRNWAYLYLLEACRGKKQLILDEINNQTERFISYIADGSTQPMSIIDNTFILS